MPLRDVACDVVRIVVGRRGTVPVRMDLTLRFDYGRLVPWVSRTPEGSPRAVAGPHAAVLRTPAVLEGRDLRTTAAFTVRAGERVPFVLSYRESHLPVPEALDAEDALHETEAFWDEWAGQCTYEGPWSEAVVRSLVTLKAMTYRPTGGLVAAPATSLPEQPGGSRNWDYRFCWLRDASFMVSTLIEAGYHEEAAAWRDAARSRSSRSTASPASTGSTSGRCRGCRASRARARSGSAMPPSRRSRSTSSARS